jgi:hypothetical protein
MGCCKIPPLRVPPLRIPPVQNIVNAVVNVANKAADTVVNVAKQAVSAIEQAAKDLVNILGKSMDVINKIKDSVESIPKKFTDIGNQIVDAPNKIKEKLTDQINNIVNKIENVFNSVGNIFSKVVTIYNCLVAFFDFIGELCKYVVKFISWLFLHFFPWLGQYIECAFSKIINLPNCFIWYALDTLAFTIYLPFRFLFWLLDTVFNLNSAVQNLEHDCWVMLDNLDEYVYSDKTGRFGPGLNTGFHIIHFPNSVMEKCYKCKISCLSPMPCVKNLTTSYVKLSTCGSKDIPDNLKKCGKSGGNFEKC